MKKRRSLKKRRRLKKKKPLLKKKGFWVFILCFLLGGALFYFLIFSETFQIKEISVSGNARVLSEDLQGLVGSKIEKRLLAKTRSLFLVNSKQIQEGILDEFPLIARAILKRRFPATLMLEVEERACRALFCLSSGDCFKIDEKGIAFEPGAEGNGLVIFFQKDEEVFLGKEVVRQGHLESIFTIQERLKIDLRIEIDRFLLFEEEVIAKIVEGFDIRFNLREDIEEQIFNLDQVLKEKISPEQRETLEYIDLRFEERVFYK